MAAALKRRLYMSRRHVPLDRSDEYLLAWAAARRAVESAGAHAWIFRGAEHEDRFIEFVEWAGDGASPLDDSAVAAALDLLDAFAMATHSEEWEETQ
ncbi:MAG: hypothetical protein WD054_02615 [Gemmatimonadota bacterium]